MNNSGHGGGESSLTPLLRAQGATLHADAAAAFSMEDAFPPGPLGSAHQPIAMAPQVVCKRCLYPGVDVKLLDCGCSFHAVRTDIWILVLENLDFSLTLAAHLHLLLFL